MRHKRLTLEEICQKWENDKVIDGKPLTRTSFYRHKDAIPNMFGIIIECDLEHGYKYFIANPDVLDDDSIERWMLSTLTVNAALSNTISLKERILLENVPAGEEYLITIIDAMRLGRRIRIVYQRFGADSYENIVFRAFGWSPDYLRILPFHHSQRKIAHTDQHADFSLDIIYRA